MDEFIGVKKYICKFKSNILISYYVKSKENVLSHFIIGDAVLFNITFNVAEYFLP